MTTDIGEEIATRIRELGLASDDEIEGCSRGEIEHIERECTVSLPRAYRSFLEQLGNASGDYLRGFVCHYPRVIGQQSKARRLFQRAETTAELEQNHFVCAGSQDVTFFYFDVRDPDPPVSVIAESHGDPDRVTERFSAWLYWMLDLQT